MTNQAQLERISRINTIRSIRETNARVWEQYLDGMLTETEHKQALDALANRAGVLNAGPSIWN